MMSLVEAVKLKCVFQMAEKVLIPIKHDLSRVANNFNSCYRVLTACRLSK